MCGIAGCVDANRSSADAVLTAAVTGMCDVMRHRGPDDSGVWTDAAQGVALGFRRLSIIDLSPTGHQPMVSADGRYVIVFNGETYNYRSLRADLEAKGVRFRGTSDTEVLLEAISAWGPYRALELANGMFAFACWDREEQALFLARDRFGEKPLYYGWVGHELVFGSELKALRAHPRFTGRVDRRVLGEYFRYGCVPAPDSIYEGVHKLPPASIVRIDPRQVGVLPESQSYWSALEVALDAASNPRSADRADLAELVEQALRDSVDLRMVADVPVGAFLSGGTDSSLVVALMQSLSSAPVRTFTIGFEAEGYDEAARARAIAEHLATDHTELYVTPSEAQAVVPRLPTIYDEPFADSSQIPTLLVAELARRDVTVALSGDGGDELFGGYTRYFAIERLRRMAHLPRALRAPIAAALRSQPPERWDRIVRGASRLLRRASPAQPGDKVHKLAGALTVDAPDDVYHSLVSVWSQDIVHGAEPTPAATAAEAMSLDAVESAMLADTLSYLPDDLLVKVDRASMAVSLEARVPMLDPNVFATAWSLPRSAKVRGGRGKLVLLDVLRRHLPDHLVGGAKVGFGVPFGDWLRGPLRSWADDLLDPARLRDEGFVDEAVVRTAWEEHLRGDRDRRHELWAALMFEAWLERERAA